MRKTIFKKSELQNMSTKEDIEIAIAQIVTAVIKSQENFATKDDLKKLATKEDLKKVENKVDVLQLDMQDVKFDVSDIKRRMTDLEADTPSKSDFEALEKRIKN